LEVFVDDFLKEIREVKKALNATTGSISPTTNIDDFVERYGRNKTSKFLDIIIKIIENGGVDYYNNAVRFNFGNNFSVDSDSYHDYLIDDRYLPSVLSSLRVHLAGLILKDFFDRGKFPEGLQYRGHNADNPILVLSNSRSHKIPRKELRGFVKNFLGVMKVMKKTFDTETSNDASISSSPIGDTKKLGGIDLNPALLNLQIKRDGSGVPLPLLQQPIHTMQIDGFIPIIINITPTINLPMLLGLGDLGEDGGTIDLGYELNVDGIEPKNRLYARDPNEMTALN